MTKEILLTKKQAEEEVLEQEGTQMKKQISWWSDLLVGLLAGWWEQREEML